MPSSRLTWWRKRPAAAVVAVASATVLMVGVIALVSDIREGAGPCGAIFGADGPEDLAQASEDELAQGVAMVWALHLDHGEHGDAYELLSTRTLTSLGRDRFDEEVEALAGHAGAASDLSSRPVVDAVPGGLGSSDRAWVVTFTGWVDDGQDLVMGGFPVVIIEDERSACGGLAVDLTAESQQLAEQTLTAVLEEHTVDPGRVEAVAPPTVEAALLEEPREGASWVTGYRATDVSDPDTGYYLIAAWFDGDVACVVADQGEQTFDGPCLGLDDPPVAFWALPDGTRRLVTRVTPDAARAEAVGRQSSGALYVSGGEVAGEGPLAIFDTEVPEDVTFHVVRVFDGDGNELVRYDIDQQPIQGS